MNRQRLPIIALLVIALIICLGDASGIMAQRRINPVTAPSAQREPVDSALIRQRQLEQRRARSVHYHDANGKTIMVDTVTNTEWVDSTLLPPPPKMIYPTIQDIAVGVNIFDPLMRAFGQHYGGADASVSLSIHNRYFPTFEFGLGTAKNTPSGNNFTYRSPLAPYFKIGADYNFLYNSDPAYRFFAGLRYGFSTFKFSVDDVTINDPYWQEGTTMSIPSASVTSGWWEVVLGLRVKLWKQISAGWQVKYHSILHRSHPATGDAWYIPGFGTAGSSLAGSFSIFYTFSLNKRKSHEVSNIAEQAEAEALP